MVPLNKPPGTVATETLKVKTNLFGMDVIIFVFSTKKIF